MQQMPLQGLLWPHSHQGHLQAMKWIFGYLKCYSSGKILVDPEYQDWSKYDQGQEYNWQESYQHAQEEIPYDMQEPLGRSARITCYVDANHMHDQATRGSVMGILLFINGMPIKWVSKQQNTVESRVHMVVKWLQQELNVNSYLRFVINYACLEYQLTDLQCCLAIT